MRLRGPVCLRANIVMSSAYQCVGDEWPTAYNASSLSLSLFRCDEQQACGLEAQEAHRVSATGWQLSFLLILFFITDGIQYFTPQP